MRVGCVIRPNHNRKYQRWDYPRGDGHYERAMLDPAGNRVEIVADYHIKKR